MRRGAGARRQDIPIDKVAIVYLNDGVEPPAGESYLLMDWKSADVGCVVHHDPHGVRYAVGANSHAFWIIEARHVARRLNFERVYYRGRPSLSASDDR